MGCLSSAGVDHQPTLARQKPAKLSREFTKIGALLLRDDHVLRDSWGGETELEECRLDLLLGGGRVGRVDGGGLLQTEREGGGEFDLYH